MATGTVNTPQRSDSFTIDYLNASIDSHSATTPQWLAGTMMWRGWIHNNALIAHNTDLIRINKTGFQEVCAFAFANPGQIQLCRVNDNGSGLIIQIDQDIANGSYLNFIIIALTTD
ncbi:MAG: hypothetical protein IKY66_07530 [Bacteroidales bacterium]|nr:hypothetical protein [Bacteroidales bacterium]